MAGQQLAVLTLRLVMSEAGGERRSVFSLSVAFPETHFYEKLFSNP